MTENENENENENEKFKKYIIVKDANIKELIEEPKDIKSLNWLDKNKFKEILAIIDSNQFNYRNKIGEFNYIDTRDLVNNIRNNTISEIDAKKNLNTLNKIKTAEIIKHKRFTTKHKELLNLFNYLLDIILTDKTLISSKDENKKLKEEKENENDNENEDEDDGDVIKILIHSNEYDEETDQNKKSKITKKINDHLDEIIDKSKSFEDQIKSIKKLKI